MRALVNQAGLRVIVETLLVWLLGLVLAKMVLDGGWFLSYYAVASALFWSVSLIYFWRPRYLPPRELWMFRMGPLILFALGLVGGTIVTEMIG